MVLLVKEHSRNLPIQGFVVRVSGRDPVFRGYIGLFRGYIGVIWG